MCVFLKIRPPFVSSAIVYNWQIIKFYTKRMANNCYVEIGLKCIIGKKGIQFLSLSRKTFLGSFSCVEKVDNTNPDRKKEKNDGEEKKNPFEKVLNAKQWKILQEICKYYVNIVYQSIIKTLKS